MSKKIINETIIDKFVDTVIDSIRKKTVDRLLKKTKDPELEKIIQKANKDYDELYSYLIKKYGKVK